MGSVNRLIIVLSEQEVKCFLEQRGLLYYWGDIDSVGWLFAGDGG